jgi:hypothetical protein
MQFEPLAWFQASAAMSFRSSFLWDVTQRILLATDVSGQLYRHHLRGSSSPRRNPGTLTVGKQLYRKRCVRCATFAPFFMARYLMELSTAKITHRRSQINEWVWSTGGMIMTGVDRSTQRKIHPTSTFSTTNPTWAGVRWNPVLGGEGMPTNRLSDDTVKCFSFSLTIAL